MALIAVVLQAGPRRAAAVVAASAGAGPRSTGAFLPTSVLQSVYNSKGGSGTSGSTSSRAGAQAAAAFFSSCASSWGLLGGRQCPAGRPRPRQQGRVLASVLSGSPSASASTKAAPGAAASAVVRVMGDGEGGIKKPARDDRQYRMLWLRNGLQVRRAFSWCGAVRLVECLTVGYVNPLIQR